MVPVTIFVACAAAPPPQPDGPPQRIVSLIPAVTETLFAVGAGPNVVGVGSFDAWPPEVAYLPRVGGLIDPDTERILSLQPDLVFAYGSQHDLIAQLSAARIPIEPYRHGSLMDVIDSVRSVGRRAGRADAAARVAGDMERIITEVRARRAGGPSPRVLLVFGRERGMLRGIFASGGVGFLHDMLTIAGGRNVLADIPRESVQASLESILARAPDIILEVRAPGVAGSTRTDEPARVWSAASSLPAVKHGRVHALVDERLVVPGPRLAHGLLLLEAALWR